MHDGFTLAIVGRPNVGKSSLFNRLLEQDRAIVTEIPGTTRDLVSETASLQGIPVKFVDTAGIRKGQDRIEQLGIERSFRAMADADLTLVIVDLSAPFDEQDHELIQKAREQGKYLVAGNKADLPRRAEGDAVPVSALTGEGVPELKQHLIETIAPRGRLEQEGGFITSLRHEHFLKESREALEQAMRAVASRHPARNASARSLRRAPAHRCHYRSDHRRRYFKSDFLDILHREIDPDSLVTRSAIRTELANAELRAMFHLAAPLVLAEVGWMAMGVVDTMFVGRVSAAAIGAVSIGTILFYTAGMIASGLLLGLDTLVSRAFGAGDTDDCRRSLINGTWLALLLMAPVMILVWASIPLLTRFGIDPAVLEQARPYMRAVDWSTIPLLLYFAFRRYLQAIHVVRPIMITLTSANLVNLAGNWILVFGHLGAPRLEAEGAGWSTCISRAYMMLVLGVIIWKRDRLLLHFSWKPDFRRIRRLLCAWLSSGHADGFGTGRICNSYRADRKNQRGGSSGTPDRAHHRQHDLHDAFGDQLRRCGPRGARHRARRSRWRGALGLDRSCIRSHRNVDGRADAASDPAQHRPAVHA